MRITLSVSAWSNISYKREKTIESDYTASEWAEMDEKEKTEYLDELFEEFVREDLSCDAHVSED